MKIAREIGDRRGEGTTLYNMAFLLSEQGDSERAIDLGERSLAILKEIEDPDAEKARAALAGWRGGG